MNLKKIFLVSLVIILTSVCCSRSQKEENSETAARGKMSGKEEKKERVKLKEKKKWEILDKNEKEYLLRLARRTLDEYLGKKGMPRVETRELTDTLQKEFGCFVTLNMNNNLRGCIGYLNPIKPLYQAVMDNAINAAVGDPRFAPVKHEDLKEIKIEISTLSIPKKLEFSSPDDLLEKLVPARDGVILRIGSSSSTFLPQVWKGLPNKSDFLRQLCLKGGNHPEAWKGKDVEIYTYFADVFEEEF